MKAEEPFESDWKTYRSMLAVWRERYLQNRNKELIDLLTRESSTPTENFWDTLESMKKIERILVECLDDIRRSRMHTYLTLMHHYRMITDADLEVFSDEIRSRLLPPK